MRISPEMFFARTRLEEPKTSIAHAPLGNALFTRSGAVSGIEPMTAGAGEVALAPHYVENWSTTGGLRIMWRSVGVVIAPVGAF
ncbi:hypothetical protein [Rhodoglobus aureus]|uniref:Uncharacterized protein n=1 Tax=Rhodoglobus aureus TaxID=191497 RepID=A0ABN1VWT6_9MICO